jgi:hypothetical protein
MPNYQAYPNKKNTPSRLTRKQQRNKTFVTNKNANKKLIKARKDVRDARLEAAALAEENEQA